MYFVAKRAVVVAQLADWLLLTPEGVGSNPAIRNFYKENLLIVNC